MTAQNAILRIRAQVRRMTHRLNKTGTDPSNADRALWGALVVGYFASATGRAGDVQTDPETLLSDLLADLMHWCGAQTSNGELQESIGFDSALERASDYYEEERVDELARDTDIRE
jgi:hypothetical protein